MQSYRRVDLPQITLLNLFAEQEPPQDGQIALLPRPALEVYATRGEGPSRGLYSRPGSLDNKLFAASGVSLFADAVNIGSLPGGNPVKMSAELDVLLIATGDKLYSSDGASVTAVEFPDDAGVADVAFLGGYAFAIRAGSRRLYFSLDHTTWDGLDYLSAEQGTGNALGLAVVIDQLWVFCEDRTEIFTLTGDADMPLQRVEGRMFDKGTISAASIAKFDNTATWVGQDGIVYRGESLPLRISDHGIEERIQDSRPADVNAWSFAWFGHLFYVLNLTHGTFAFDAATKQWHELGSYGMTGWRARSGILYEGKVITGDARDGTLWRLTDEASNDAGTPIQRVFSGIILKKVIADNISVDCSTGQTGNPNIPPGTMEMRTSRDGGQAWTGWRQTNLGREGNFRARAVFRRLGIVDQGEMLMQWRLTDTRPWRVSTVSLNDALGGRSR
jgi:hypothetical protein